jgi:ribonuclease R
MKKSTKKVPLPTKQQILEFVRESPTPVGKREIARAFHIRGDDRVALKSLLRELANEGELERGRGRRVANPTALPEVTVVQITETDPDGEVIAKPVQWRGDGPLPKVLMAPEARGQRAVAPGDRVLARLSRINDRTYEGRIVRILGPAPKRVVGVYEVIPGVGGRLRPADRRIKQEFRIGGANTGGAQPGDVVLAEPLERQRAGGMEMRIVERVGPFGSPRTISLISIHEHDIPDRFPQAALDLAAEARPVPLGERTDLRGLPLVTIDGDDARDFDDAVWATADTDPRNAGGHRLVVAIADVAHYVRPGDALDREARKRGNSVYFPDRVVPMLPEALSNELCSLKPGVERACLAVEMIIDRDGNKLGHKFMRGLMRSAARLTYDQVQAARDGAPGDPAGPLRESVIAPLYAAYEALMSARRGRGTLDLDLPERRVFFNSEGYIDRIVPRQRLDSHRLIEEFMIAANVAAAESLEAKRRPCMYRIHDAPDRTKIEALREFVGSLGLSLARGQVLKPATFARLLEQAAKTPYAAMLNDLVLRSQSQAEYSPENIGHFGLALRRYCHFTSPIRRYADLLVHRALIDGFRFGPDGLPPDAAADFQQTGEKISATERRAATAERDAMDRYIAAFLSERINDIFVGRVSGVTRFGLFVTLDDSGGSGLIPISTLPTDFYEHDDRRHALVGRRWGRVFSLGDVVAVRLVEATPVTGGMVLELIETEESAVSAEARKPRGNPGKGGPAKHRPRNKGPKSRPKGHRRRRR